MELGIQIKDNKHIEKRTLIIYFDDNVFLGPLTGLEKRVKNYVENHRDFTGKRLADYSITIITDGDSYEPITYVKLTKQK